MTSEQMTKAMKNAVEAQPMSFKKLAAFIELGQIVGEEGRMTKQVEKPKEWDKIKPFLMKGYSYTGMFNHVITMPMLKEMIELYGQKNLINQDLQNHLMNV